MSKEKFNWWKWACAALLLSAATAIASQTFTTLVSFNVTDGSTPYFMSLVQGTDGKLYGTTQYGGANGKGTVFKMTASGGLTTLHSFNGTDGFQPYAGLVLGTQGNFYGTTAVGGANNNGTVFKITAAGVLTTLYSFCSQMNCADGDSPSAGLVQGKDGNFYGTTTSGGKFNNGTAFKITGAGALTTIYNFCSQSQCQDGAVPWAALVQASNGKFYGTTSQGGPNAYGTVFDMTPSGTLTTLYTFQNHEHPMAPLIQAANGNLYGTTQGGGTNGFGTVFVMTPGGTVTTLHSFDGSDGQYPQAPLIQATNEVFYGTTEQGGVNSVGTIFKITTTGTLSTLYSFCSKSNCADGYGPFGGLLQATNGKFYGTTYAGGSGVGTVFSLAVGLGPFVETNPTSGKVGAAVIILGNNLTGATKVSFNGTAATFKVVSNTEIKTTVPSGATTGFVTVTTSSGTLKSNVKFRVT